MITERRGLVARIGEIAPDVVLIDLGNPSRDVLEVSVVSTYGTDSRL